MISSSVKDGRASGFINQPVEGDDYYFVTLDG